MRRAIPLILRLLMNFFFFNDTATTEIYTLSLHDALPISGSTMPQPLYVLWGDEYHKLHSETRSEEHTSELQSRLHLVCRLLLEKKISTTPEAASVTTLEISFAVAPI